MNGKKKPAVSRIQVTENYPADLLKIKQMG